MRIAVLGVQSGVIAKAIVLRGPKRAVEVDLAYLKERWGQEGLEVYVMERPDWREIRLGGPVPEGASKKQTTVKPKGGDHEASSHYIGLGSVGIGASPPTSRCS